MNAATQPADRSPFSCPDVSNVERQSKLDNAVSTQLSATESAFEHPGRTFLDILLRCLSAPNA